MSEQNFNSLENRVSGEMDVAKTLRYILIQSKMICLVTLIGLIVSATYYLTSTKFYKITSLLQVESFNQNSLDPTNTFEMMTPLSTSADLDNLIKLYKSRTNILQLISDLNLNVQIDNLSDTEIIDIEFTPIQVNDFPYEVTFYILPTNNSIEVFLNKGDEKLTEADYGQEITLFNQFIFKVKSVNLENNRLLKIQYKNPVLLYPRLKNTIDLTPNSQQNFMKRDQGLIEVSLITSDINQGKKIIDHSNKIFINQRLTAETEKSRAAIKFIDSNLIGLQETVSQNKDKLKEFMELNKSIDLDLETQVIVDTVKSLDESLSEIEVELANASKLYTENNPAYINLLNKKKIFNNQKNEILSKIKVMPKEQQLYIDLFNQVDVTQNLLEELESRRLGFSILEASTIGDIKVVDSAYMESKVAPKIISILITTFIAFLLSIATAVMRGIYFLPITNPAEILDNDIFEPIMGVIPFDEDIEKVDLNSDASRYKSAMESTIINIRSMEEEKDNEATIISLTSPSPLNGKSTSCKKLAETLSLLGKKVLLIDADFKRGSLAKDFNVKSISQNTFFDINPTNLDSYRISDRFYLIPRVKGLVNSFQFICDQRYSKIIQDLKNNFDYIIFDTAPLLSVADTSVILKLADINLLVVRHEVNKIKEIRQAIDVFAQIRLPMNGFIYNAYAKAAGYYGYDGFYGNYAYSYYADKYLNDSYEYKAED